MALTRLPSFTIDSTSSFTFANVIVTSNVAAANANLGNSVTANYFIGNGSLLTGLPASYTDSNVAAYLPTFTGNIAANVITATSLSGNGSALTSVDAVTLNGFTSTSFATSAQGTKADSALQAADLTGYATESYVGNSIANLIASAPAALDTLNELANALGNDASFSTSITNSLANKLSTSDFTSTATTWISTQSTSNLSEGTNLYYTEARANSSIDARVTKTFVDNLAVVANIANVAYSVAGANVSGQVSNALIAGTVYTNAQPNITSVGTLTTLSVTANVVAGNILTDNLLYSNGTAWSLGSGGGGSSAPLAMNGDSFTGDGSNVDFSLSVTPSSSYYTIVTIGGVAQPRSFYSVTGNVITFSTAPPNNSRIDVTTFGGNASYMSLATAVTNSSQPNITSVGTLTSLVVTGNVTANKFIGDGSLLTNISAGTVTTAAQPNITSVGALTSLSVTGNITSGNANLGNLVIANFYSGNGSLLSSITGANVSGTVANATYAVTAGTANSVAGANVSGTVALATSATSATTAETVTTAAQPNITLTGTLSSLAVSGNATFSSWITLQQSSEVINTKNGATGTVEHDLSTGATFYHTSPSANFTANFTNVSTTDSRAIVTALVIIQGSTPYVANAVQIDGSAQTIKWIGSTAPTGTASKTDVISFTLMRVGGIWSVYGQYSSYG